VFSQKDVVPSSTGIPPATLCGVRDEGGNHKCGCEPTTINNGNEHRRGDVVVEKTARGRGSGSENDEKLGVIKKNGRTRSRRTEKEGEKEDGMGAKGGALPQKKRIGRVSN